MKQILPTLFLFLGLHLTLYAQDAIYTANGNRLDNARVADLTDDRITFTIQQTDKLNTHSFQRQNVLVAFRKGNFLLIDKLNPDLALAKQELQSFLTTTVWQNKDYLLRAVPFGVLPAKISYENDAVVNYLTSDGKSASISKGELIAIFYGDGRHSLIRDASEAAPLLVGVKELINAANEQPVASQPPVKDPAPIPQPTLDQPKDNSPQPVSIPASPTPVSKLVLNAADYQQYRKKALDKVEEFSSYLNIITNKSLSSNDRNQAIEQAVSLFMPAATIEVTSSKRTGARRYPIRTYLNNLKLLPYSSTTIEWTEIQYLKELSQAADGNYYGVITAQQTFVGRGENTYYSDVTQKNVRVKLERYHMIKNGQEDVKWNLLLGSIGVSAQ
ncbi:hypothetical protein M0L20_28300 [Spirosoma sp. RP8]|uniref:Uncharacterized protein n=1 Tax=Spirosoma liriopis TaxID=2937440 RepID=A0ABT0HUD4_9BACT|nr:hypothetical protein [Spirosoma liriopis]MCK8495801.1 hypothetical protein [Spirosoma liriopis]